MAEPPIDRALVLGGGGLAGIAWACGYLAALQEEAVALEDAEQIVGTSAGSVVGAWLTAGKPLASRLGFLENAVNPMRRALTALFAAASPEPDPTGREALAELMASPDPSEDDVRRLGVLAAESSTMSEALFVGFTTALVGRRTWRTDALRTTAYDIEAGARVVLAPGDGVGLGRACAASSAVPGVFPPVRVRGRRLMDGGCRSGTNADLASGAARVLVLSLLPREPAEAPPWLAREVDSLEREGTSVYPSWPDEASTAATGGDALDPRAVPAVARAGHAQGLREAAAARTFWCEP